MSDKKVQIFESSQCTSRMNLTKLGKEFYMNFPHLKVPLNRKFYVCLIKKKYCIWKNKRSKDRPDIFVEWRSSRWFVQSIYSQFQTDCKILANLREYYLKQLTGIDVTVNSSRKNSFLWIYFKRRLTKCSKTECMCIYVFTTPANA